MDTKTSLLSAGQAVSSPSRQGDVLVLDDGWKLDVDLCDLHADTRVIISDDQVIGAEDLIGVRPGVVTWV
jgi:hypothetical protein